MPRFFLTLLKIEGFRGINNDGAPLEVRLKSDAINSIYAHNGAGKSSIFDSLMFATTKCLPRLEKLQRIDTPEKYYVNQFHSTGVSVIDAKFEADDGTAEIEIVVTRNREGIRTASSPSGHPDPDAFLKSLGCELVLLDYSAFQAFINDSPLVRGRSFAGLLGLARISEMRQTLEVLSNVGNVTRDFTLSDLERDKSAMESRLQVVEAQIGTHRESFFGSATAVTQEPAHLAAEVMRELAGVSLLKPLADGSTLATFDFDKAQAAVSAEEKGELRAELVSVLTDIAALTALAASDLESDSREQASLAALIEDHERELDATRGPLFKTLFEVVNQIVTSPDWDEATRCPACERAGDANIQDLAELRLAAYAKVTDLQSAIAAQWKSSAWVRRFSDLETSSAMQVAPDQRQFGNIDRGFASSRPTKENLGVARARLVALDATRVERLRKLEARRDEIQKLLPASLVELTTRLVTAKQLRPLLKEHPELAARLATVRPKIKVRRRWLEFIGIAAEIFKDAEVAVSKTLTNQIQSEAAQLYSAIMNNPDIVPKLKKSGTTENLELRLDSFYGQAGHSAAALLSESQRNALAVSIYLSAAARSTGTARFLVLDDVTSSFDSGHQLALMDAIKKIALPANPAGPQVIILSHDGMLQKYFDSSDGAGWHHQRLLGWPPKGNVFLQTVSAPRLRTEACQFLRNGETNRAEPLIRQYLEMSLMQVIHKVNIPVPFDFAFKEHRRMVGNCLNAIDAALDLFRAAGSLILTTQQRADLQSVHTPALVGNWVSHYETASSTAIAPNMLLRVLDDIDAYADCFRYVCSCDGASQRRYYKSLKLKHCQC